MNLAIQILASYPPSGKEKGYEAQPSGGVSAHYLHYDSDIHTPDPTNALRTAIPEGNLNQTHESIHEDPPLLLRDIVKQ